MIFLRAGLDYRLDLNLSLKLNIFKVVSWTLSVIRLACSPSCIYTLNAWTSSLCFSIGRWPNKVRTLEVTEDMSTLTDLFCCLLIPSKCLNCQSQTTTKSVKLLTKKCVWVYEEQMTRLIIETTPIWTQLLTGFINNAVDENKRLYYKHIEVNLNIVI